MLLQVSWLGTGTNNDPRQVQREEIPSPGRSLLCSHDRINIDWSFVLCVTISRSISGAASSFFNIAVPFKFSWPSFLGPV